MRAGESQKEPKSIYLIEGYYEVDRGLSQGQSEERAGGLDHSSPPAKAGAYGIR
jgi:hypothetical protein